MSLLKNVTDVYFRAKRILFDDDTKIVIMSDCHRGDGSGSDNFTQNQNIYLTALRHYYNEAFTYIELGDGDELWENKEFRFITENHNIIFEILSKFHHERRLHMIYGNHDMVKKDSKWAQKNLNNYINEGKDKIIPLFPDIKITEGIVLKHRSAENKILLLHGHQADRLNYTFWQLSRFLVRYLWRPLEMIGIKDPTSPANNHKTKNLVEQRLSAWARNEKIMLIAGHTHREVFPEEGESLYFNDGCCVYPHYITAIEIEKGEISLVKWRIKANKDGVLYVGKDIIKRPRKIKDYFNDLVSKM